MTRYAESTEVPADRSRAEIERTLQRYGADVFSYGWTAEAAVVSFRMKGRMVRFLLPMPNRNDQKFTHYKRGGSAYSLTRRQPDAAFKAWEQAVRQRWRALNLVIKAKLEAVESGITDFEAEFMAHILLPDGSRFGDWAVPQIDRAYETGKMPPMLPGLPAPKVDSDDSKMDEIEDAEVVT